jgi:hypothetical protein
MGRGSCSQYRLNNSLYKGFLIFKYSDALLVQGYKRLNLQQQEQFYQMMTRLKANSSSRAASVPKEDAIVTEIVDGLIVSKPAKRIEYISEPAA